MLRLMLSGLITHTKDRYMSNILEKQLYAGILAVLNDKDSYYISSVGSHHSKFEKNGEQAVMDFVKQFAPLMLKKQNEDLDERAKKLMWDDLKK
jgi:hypothetical protein